MKMNVPVILDIDPSSLGEAIALKVEKEFRETVNSSLTKLFSDGRYTMEWTSSDPRGWVYSTRGVMFEEVRDFLRVNREEILKEVVKEVSARVLRSTRNKNEIVEQLLKILTMTE